MANKLFVAGVGDKGGKPSDWRGCVLVFLPLFGVLTFKYLGKKTGKDYYYLLRSLCVVFALLLLVYMFKSAEK